MRPIARSLRWALVAGIVTFVALGAFLAWILGAVETRIPGYLDVLSDAQRGALILFPFLIAALVAVLVGWVHDSFAAAALRFADHADVLRISGVGQRLHETGPAEARLLAAALNRLTEASMRSVDEIAIRVQSAKADSERDRNMFAALVDEMEQGVVVCNMAGEILLYNSRARDLLGASQDSKGGFVGLGRPLGGVLEAGLVEHLRERIGVAGGGFSFATSTWGGRLIRARVAEFHGPKGTEGETFKGFVFVADDISFAAEALARQQRALQALIERVRGGLGTIEVAANKMQRGDMGLESDAWRHELCALSEEANRLGQYIVLAQREQSDVLQASQPLEEIRAEDLIAAVRRRIEARVGLPSKLEEEALSDTVQGDARAWVRVDSFTLMQALTFLAIRASEACSMREVRFRHACGEALVMIDMVWASTALSTETAMGWELEPMTLGGESSPMSVREVTERHGARLLYERNWATGHAFFRLELPRVRPREVLPEVVPLGGGRPEFYDFDLFSPGHATRSLGDTALSTLAFTVFDTETTGLDPSGGDEIIQIGALRIVNGRLLRSECFEQLIDPRRPIHPAAMRIHGITPERLRGAPVIREVLPRFHAFCRGTVLVAHNAAFDMRFLQLKEQTCGLCFDHAVLDTLLLSAVLHPEQETHRLEAIAERFGVAVVDRHDAMGDALVAAQLLLRMIPLLAERGIRTLAQALVASEKTYHARIRY